LPKESGKKRGGIIMFKTWWEEFKMDWGRLHRQSNLISAIFEEVLQSEWKEIKITRFHVIIITVDGAVLNFWNSNKYYAWADRGTYTKNEKETSWEEEMPSGKMLVAMKKAIEERTLKLMNNLDYTQSITIK
jgi:hypothetical protein